MIYGDVRKFYGNNFKKFTTVLYRDYFYLSVGYIYFTEDPSQIIHYNSSVSKIHIQEIFCKFNQIIGVNDVGKLFIGHAAPQIKENANCSPIDKNRL